MPLIQSFHDSLEYIDAPPAPDSTTASQIASLIASELPPDASTTLHPSIPTSYAPTYPSLISQEHERLAAEEPKQSGIDLSRYESIEPPTDSSSPSEAGSEWRTTLQKAYASSTYLSSRLTNLGLLETYGKNAWLISNAQLEDTLKTLEREVGASRAHVEYVNEARRQEQVGVASELAMLEETWRRGVGRVVETEVAAEVLRREIIEKQRAGAV